MELYSRNPPSIAPSRFEERATAIEEDFFSSVEKANPEKKRGSVSIAVIMSWLNKGATLLKSTNVKPNPMINDKRSNKYVINDEGLPILLTSKLAKNAMIRIAEMTMLITIHVLP